MRGSAAAHEGPPAGGTVCQLNQSTISRALTPGSIEGAGKLKRQSFALAQGIDKDSARQITKILKESKLKIQSQINGDKVRVTGKKRDDLQAAMAALKESDIAMPLQYNNFRD